MSFTHPYLLFLLVIPALLLAWVWRKSRGDVVLPLDHAPTGSGWGLKGLVNSAESLPAIILVVVILILAGPQQLSEPKTKRVLTNIEFCVDISGSMTASMGDGNRYDASMEAINEFLDFREGDDFGLTFFGNSVLHWVPLTSDVSAIRCSPPFMRPEMVPPWFGGTEIGKALLACKDVLTVREEGDRMIVLVSDGYSADLGRDRDKEIAQILRNHNIAVYAVHVAGSGIPDPIVNITALTGGEAFQAGDKEGLKAVFRQIDAMQETRLEKANAETMDHFYPYSMAGLVVLGLSSLSLFGVRYTPW